MISSKPIDPPIGSLIVVDGTICEVVLDRHQDQFPICQGCIMRLVNRCDTVPYECVADFRADHKYPIFAPIDID